MRLALPRFRGLAARNARIAVLGSALVLTSGTLALADPGGGDVPEALAEPVGILPAPAHREAPPTTQATTSTTGAPTTTAAPTTSLPESTTVAAEMARVPTTTAAPAAPAPSAARRSSTSTTDAPVTTPPPGAADTTAPASGPNCVVRLHGKGGAGSAARERDGYVELAPTGNASGWGGRQWLYFPESGYQAGRAAVANAIDGAGCRRVVIDGFSNGAAFAAKLYCRGESFGGRLAGVIVDDPVTDHAVEGCAPASGVRVTLYWTGALQGVAQPGWSCASADWTCEGGSTIGIAAYAAALGTTAKQSPNSGHSAYANPPELTRF